jgi:two-component system, LytTR family, response regulator
MMINAIIVDDEKLARETLYDLLFLNFSKKIRIIASVESAEEARKIIRSHPVDLVFLDVEMPKENGFDLLSSLDHINFGIIFTTSHAGYAIKALRSGALDFLVKPVNLDELSNAIGKFDTYFITSGQAPGNKVNDHLVNFYDALPLGEQKKDTILVAHQNGLKLYPFKEIVRFEGDGNYTRIITLRENALLSSRTLKYFEDRLISSGQFYRAHKSSLVNIVHVKEIHRSDKGYFALMNDGQEVEISRRAYSGFIEKLRSAHTNLRIP